MNYCLIESPVGSLLVAGDEAAVRRIEFPRDGKPGRPQAGWRESMAGPVQEAVRQLGEYFSGRRTVFDLPLVPEGTEFQRTVWRLPARHPLRADDLLWRAGEARRQSEGIAGRRSGQRLQSAANRDSLPSSDRR